MEIFSINDICEIKSGKRIPLGFDFVNYKTSHPYIRARDIKNGNINTEDLIYLEENTYNKIKKYIINENDIAITIVGASIGDIGFAQKDVDGFNLTENAVRLTRFNGKANSKYIYYLLNQKQYKELMQTIAGGAAQPKLGIYKIQKIKVCLPPLHNQEKIASVLSAYDNLIENNIKRIKILEQMAENLYKEWFVHFRFPGHETSPIENGISKGWTIEKLGNVSNISTGKCNREDAEEDGEYPLFDRSQEIKKSSEWIKDCEAIIVPGEGTSFMPRYYWGKFNLHQRCYCIEPKDNTIGKFLFFVLKLNRKYFLSVATGATVPSLRYNNFAKMQFVMPPKKLCQKFNEIAKNNFAMVDSLKKQNENLIKQRDLLLPRLMSGKLAV
ncbi:type I restriction enzyme, S subunit [Fibrobacter sp. UWB16]|uniref:restriction endonuclease subunit S n=1 Tax=Fibrobacter sp. UWB16 TaxID=1945874 RepID=UPI000BD10546|nr:restriction endonuclease subunit S [Fibrobacter sp. UWB16]SOD15950.1 type I restriction enzyme, S subunit [Fibrobacter sp. UWB16]